MRTLRSAIAALIWASALAASAEAAQLLPSPGGQKNALAPIESPSATAQPAEQTSYRYDTPDIGTPTPGPTDPNGPSS
jgi:hypothetical protein